MNREITETREIQRMNYSKRKNMIIELSPFILDIAFHSVKLFSKHPTRLEIQHTLIPSAAGEKKLFIAIFAIVFWDNYSELDPQYWSDI